MIDEKDFENLLETLKEYCNTAWEMYYDYRELGPEWEKIAESNLAEATAYEIAILNIKKAFRGYLL